MNQLTSKFLLALLLVILVADLPTFTLARRRHSLRRRNHRNRAHRRHHRHSHKRHHKRHHKKSSPKSKITTKLISHKMMIGLIRKQVIKDRNMESKRESAWMRLINILNRRNNQRIAQMKAQEQKFMNKFIKKFQSNSKAFTKQKAIVEQQYKKNVSKANKQIAKTLAQFKNMSQSALAQGALPSAAQSIKPKAVSKVTQPNSYA